MLKKKYQQPEVKTEENEMLNTKRKLGSNGNTNQQQKPFRLDCRGVKIIKGGKKHQIMFKNVLAEEHTVENWKEFNVLDEDEKQESDQGSWAACKRYCLVL